MHLLLSGEGPTDIGVCNPSSGECEGSRFKAGPMSWIVDQLLESCQGYEFSHLESNCVSFVSESYLRPTSRNQLESHWPCVARSAVRRRDIITSMPGHWRSWLKRKQEQ